MFLQELNGEFYSIVLCVVFYRKDHGMKQGRRFRILGQPLPPEGELEVLAPGHSAGLSGPASVPNKPPPFPGAHISVE